MSGTYSVAVVPFGSGTGSFTATLSTPVARNLLLEGGPTNVSLTRAGQAAQLTFTGTAGQTLGLGITGLTLSPASSTSAQVVVYAPDGSPQYSNNCPTTAPVCPLNLSNLPMSGTYSVVVAPQNSGTGTFTATLSHEATGVLTAGTPLNLNLSRAGQTGRLTFNGAAGDVLGLGFTGVTLTNAYVLVYKPDGTYFANITFSNGSTTTLSLPPLPVTGTYTVLITPGVTTGGSMTFLLSPALQVPLTLGGAPSNVNLATAGQPAQLKFIGSVGQNLGLGITGLTLSPVSSTSADVYIYKPDGSRLMYMACPTTSPGCELNLSKLPVNGTYSVVVAPLSGSGSFTATLSSDVTGTLTLGTPLNLNLSRPGQNGSLTFSGTAGTSPTLTFSAININPAAQYVNFAVSDGTYSYYIASTNGASPMPPFHLYSLPTTGTYTLFVDPSYAATTTMSVTLSP